MYLVGVPSVGRDFALSPIIMLQLISNKCALMPHGKASAVAVSHANLFEAGDFWMEILPIVIIAATKA